MQEKIIYPGTFDPITKGHADLARRAASLFPKVILAITENANKESSFTIEERTTFAKKSLHDYPNIQILSFNGLLMDFAREHQARMILRGLRVVSDFEYEFQLAGMNRRLNKDIETIFLTPDEKYTFISSSLVREIAMLGGDVSEFVDTHVEEAMCKKFTK